MLQTTQAAFASVGELIAANRIKSAIGEAMKTVGAVNKYLADTTPWKLKEDRDRMATVLHVALQAVDDCKTMLAPFLPFSAQKVHELLGGEGVFAPMPRIEDVEELDGTGPLAVTPTRS